MVSSQFIIMEIRFILELWINFQHVILYTCLLSVQHSVTRIHFNISLVKPTNFTTFVEEEKKLNHTCQFKVHVGKKHHMSMHKRDTRKDKREPSNLLGSTPINCQFTLISYVGRILPSYNSHRGRITNVPDIVSMILLLSNFLC